jgi:hypothetical protein
MEYNNFITITNDIKSYTFGYFWYKNNSESNERHLYLGTSGKGSCIHIVYDKNDKKAEKSNMGYFKECDVKKSLKRGEEGTYLMIFCAMYLLLKNFKECTTIYWHDNTRITLKANGKNYDISLNDTDTIIKGYTRIEDVISRDSIVFNEYNNITTSIKNLDNISTNNFQTFYKEYYEKYNLFTNEEIMILKRIYKQHNSLLNFLQKANEYLQTVNKNKWIFIPLEVILNNNRIKTFVHTIWVVDIHKAFDHIKSKYNVSFVRTQIGGGLTKKEEEIHKKEMIRKLRVI